MNTALLAGTHSGCGKTTLMLALLQYLRQHVQKVVAFKAGPDFLDPLWHQAVTGQPSYNLDTKMMGGEACRKLVSRFSKQADFGLIEGVMGLFDGHSGVGGEGSSVNLAKAINCPVLLVVDAKGMSGTIAAIVAGCCQIAQAHKVRISGIIANQVGSEYHAGLLRAALDDYQLPPLVAWMERSDQVLTERHLGLTLPDESHIPDYAQHFHVESELLLNAFAEIEPNCLDMQPNPKLQGKTIAIAKDGACCFIYPANLDWLADHSAERVFFSPVAGEPVPAGADAIWLPGGYPELYAEALSQSATWPSLRTAAEIGMPILAECGGAMLLGKTLIDITGKEWPMAGIFPYISTMQPRLAALGYREDTSGVKGHEFHYSKREQDHGLTPAFNIKQGDPGVRYKNTRASYVHWYFPADPGEITEWFMENSLSIR